MQERLTRSQVPVEETWNLDDIFPSVEAWEAEYNAVAGLIGSVTKYKGRLGEGPKILLECLNALEALQIRMAKVHAYASLNQSVDGTNPAYQAMAGRVASLAAQIQAETAFVQSEALSLPEGTLQKYLAEEPGLEPFQVGLRSPPVRLHDLDQQDAERLDVGSRARTRGPRRPLPALSAFRQHASHHVLHRGALHHQRNPGGELHPFPEQRCTYAPVAHHAVPYDVLSQLRPALNRRRASATDLRPRGKRPADYGDGA